MATAAISLVVGVGAQMLSSLFRPKQKDQWNFGPRISDINVPTVSPGNEIARLWGTMKVTGQVIYSSLLIETQHIAAERVPGGKGGKGGGGSTNYTVSYTYSVNMAVGFCRGPVIQLNRLWAGGKLLWVNPNQVGNEQQKFDDAYQSEASRLLDLGVPPEQALVSAYFFAYNNYESSSSLTIWSVNPAVTYVMSHPIPGYPQTNTLDYGTVYGMILQMFDPVQWNQNFVPTVIRYDSIVQYIGDEFQLPDPTIETAINGGTHTNGTIGVVNGLPLILGGGTSQGIGGPPGSQYVSGYRGLCYAMINNLQLADFGNTVPQISAEVMADGTSSGVMDASSSQNLGAIIGGILGGASGGTAPPPQVGFGTGIGYGAVASATQPTIIQILNEILRESALTADEFDTTTAIPGSMVCDGFAITQVVSVRQVLQDLQKVFQFDGCESGYKVKFQIYNKRPCAILNSQDFGAHIDTDEMPFSIQQTRTSELDLPRRINFKYQEEARNYSMNTVWAARNIGNSLTIEDMDVTIALGRSVAKTQVEAALALRFALRNTYKVKLPRKYIILEPGDVVLCPDADYPGEYRQWRVTGLTVGANGIIEADFQDADFNLGDLGAITGTAQDVGDVTKPVLVNTSRTVGYCLDIPIPNDIIPDGPQFYTVVTGVAQGWKSGGLLIDLANPGDASAFGASGTPSSSGPAWYGISTGSLRVPCGFATKSLDPTVKPGTWDYKSEVLVWLFDPTWVLVNADPVDMMTQALNTCYIGGEICAFANAESLGNGNWKLTKWLRGLRGTDYVMPLHKGSEEFVWLSPDNLERVVVTQASIGKEGTYCAVTSGTTLDSNTEFKFTDTGNALRPYAPAVTSAHSDESHNFTMTWQPRNRLNGKWLSGSDIILDQAVEAYSIDVVTTSAGTDTVHATYDLGAVRTWTYSASDQTTDVGFSGTGITIVLYQIGAIIGRGFPTRISL